MRLLRQVGVYAKPFMCFTLALALYSECLALRTYSFRARPKPEIKKPSAPSNRTTSLSELTKDHNVSTTVADADREAKKQIVENYGRLPLSFEINEGQIDREVKFFSRGAGYGLYLTSSEAVMVLNKPARSKPAEPDKENKAATPVASSNDVITMRVSGANPRSRALGLDVLPGKSNYFIGNDPAKWRTNVSNYSKVKYEKIYPGIDMIYYGNQRQLEYDFIVSPRADVSVIKLSFDGVDNLNIEESGDLVLSTKGGDVRQHKPIVYQQINGKRREITAGYVRLGEREVGFKLGAYDRSKPLIIDPVISYGTYLGGQGGYDWGYGIAVDASGNAVIAGETGSPNFPTRFSLQAFGGFAGIRGDAFITKLNATGTQLIFSTYFGGSSADVAQDVALDAVGDIYFAGWTSSNNFPTTSGAFQTSGGSSGNLEATVTKLNSTGSAILYSTYLGARDSDYGYGIAVDSSGNAYVTGRTDSNNFPTTSGAFRTTFNGGTCGPQGNTWVCTDSFVTKINPTGSGLVYSTYLGGTGDDRPNWNGGGIAVDALGAAYLTGVTRSTNFPILNAIQSTHAPGVSPGNSANGLNSDVYVTKLNPSGGSLAYSTFLGGTGDDEGAQVVVDSSGYAYVTGIGSGAAGFPTTPGAYANTGASFVAKIGPTGNDLIYSTNLPITTNSIAIDSSGNAYVTGQQNFSGYRPANVTKVNPTGTALIFSFFFGGTESQFGGLDGRTMGNDIALDSSGGMYITGDTASANFPVTSGAAQQNFGGNQCGINFCNDGFVAKIVDVSGFSISGHVTDAAGASLSGVRLTLTGGLKTWVVTDSSGNYAFTDLMPGRSYTVTPTKQFFTFAPGSRSFSNLSADQTGADFVGTIPNVTINGNVLNANNGGVSGVTVTLSGSQSASILTDSSGSYSFPNLPSGGNYTVTPTRGSDVFDPPSKTFNGIGNNQNVTFRLVHQITGQVTDAFGAPAPAVTVSLTGPKTASTQTDPNGNYTFTNVPANGNYTITPTKAGVLTYTFNPPSQTLTNLSANQVVNFSFTTSNRVTLFPEADAYVQDGTTAGSNFGTVTPLQIRSANQSGSRRDAYLKFDLSTVSRNITSAKLRISAALSVAGNIGTSAFAVADTSWFETGPTGITWNNKPALGATLGSATVTTTTYATYELDVTSHILLEKAAGHDLISLALHNPANSTNHITVNSREAPANKPQLVLITSDVNNAAPTVSLTAPLNGASLTGPVNITVTASASDSDGSISKVDFYSGTALIGTATTAPYTVQWNSVAAGSYSLKAVATDDRGATTVSDANNIIVNLANSPPQVSLTAPVSGLTFPAGGSINLSVDATDTDGTITKVDFFAGSVLIGTDTTSPYSVVWNNPTVGVQTLTAVATDNAGSTTPSDSVNVTVVWQTGLEATADAHVQDGSSAATNFGAELELQTQASATAGSNRETYLKFDITTISAITRAKLRLFGGLTDTSTVDVPAAVHPVAVTSWVESGNGSITWNNKPATGTALATVTIKSSPTNVMAVWYEWDITGYIQAEKAAGRNIVSFAVKNTATSTPYVAFNSREEASNHPQLQITTTATRNALLVTGSSTLNSAETALKTRLENLGFTVTAKVAGSNQNSAIKTTDADGKALVLISSTVTPVNVGAKFANVAVPVINWEADIFDDMGMTDPPTSEFGTTTNQTDVAIINASHPMAANLTGTVNVVSAASSFSWGKPSATATKIATLAGDATRIAIFGYDTGIVMPAFTAQARRVGFFLTDTNGANLTANGGSLFDAAVKWATTASVAPTIANLTPTTGIIGTSVTVNGYNFGNTKGTSTITFNGINATPVGWSSTTITVPVPAGASTGPVVVVVNGLASNAITFTIQIPPADTDGDGLADAWELLYFGNLNQGANDDPDGDGLNNLQEFQQGRNPTLGAVDDTGGAVQLRIYTPLIPTSP
jgi:hypothetical protein